MDASSTISHEIFLRTLDVFESVHEPYMLGILFNATSLT